MLASMRSAGSWVLLAVGPPGMGVALDVAVVEVLAGISFSLPDPLRRLAVDGTNILSGLAFAASRESQKNTQDREEQNSPGQGILQRNLHERGNAGDALADDQLVNVVRALVGVHALEIVHVAHDAVVVHDAVGA